MTPFGTKIRSLREEKGVTLNEMAEALGVSAAYLSMMERGLRGKPNRRFVHKVCHYFMMIWDEADALHELAEKSQTRIVLKLETLSEAQSDLVQLFVQKIPFLSETQAEDLISELSRVEEVSDSSLE